jgi:hypothetical protein
LVLGALQTLTYFKSLELISQLPDVAAGSFAVCDNLPHWQQGWDVLPSIYTTL